jgi:hypothetical protein
MKNILYAAGAVALVAIAGFLCLLGLEVDHARLIVETNVTAARHDLELTLNGDPNSGRAEGMLSLRERLIVEIFTHADGFRSDLKHLGDDLRKDTFDELDAIRTDAGAQLTAIQANALTAIAKGVEPLNTVAGTVGRLRKDLAPAIKNAGDISQHVADALPAFTDCAYYDEETGEPIGGNPDCAFNRFQGVSKAIEQMAQAGAAAAPKLAAAATKTGDSVAGFTAAAEREADELTRPKTKAEQVKEWLKLLPRLLVALLGL